MPKIKSFAPSWLSESAPAFQLFAPSTGSSTQEDTKPSPRRTIARRGTEVFVAIGKEIRWGDLAFLKESWESGRAKPSSAARARPDESDSSVDLDHDEPRGGGNVRNSYRTLKVPVANTIRQLVISPQGDYLAILTTHTVHICLTPDSSNLASGDTGPIKAKYWTLGPTTHVTSRAAAVSALWHPLGVNGTALVTVTEDAVVRLWELSLENKWSFDSPTLAVDLRKLADGTTLDQDFSASTVNRMAFSPDSFDMEVAAACFPQRDSGGWSPMTLWVAMRSGDIYALCPVLPQRWAPPPTLIPALSVSIVANAAAADDDLSPDRRLLAEQQLDWMAEIDKQEPKMVDDALGMPTVEVFQRPSRPGTIPRLQGPFVLDLDPEDEDELDVELTDIYVIGERINTDDLMKDEDYELDLDGMDADGLSLSVVCLLSTSGQLKVCLDLDGVEASWLPPRIQRNAPRSVIDAPSPSLLSFQTCDLLYLSQFDDKGWPMFSDDVTSRYSFFVTHSSGITHVSLSAWIFRLESELRAGPSVGSDFRLDLIVKGNGTTRQQVYRQKHQHGPLAACVVLLDPDLGYLALSAAPTGPVGLVFETSPDEDAPQADRDPLEPLDEEEGLQPLVLCRPRPVFRPSEILGNQSSPFRQMVDNLRTSKQKVLLPQLVQAKAPALSIFTNVHRVISDEVQQLNSAVAELFRRCEALKDGFREQIARANDVKLIVDSITGDDMDEEEPVSDNAMLQGRLRLAKTKQEGLNARVDALRKKLGRMASRELSDKEVAWQEEVRRFESAVSEPVEPGEKSAQVDKHEETGGPPTRTKSVAQRFTEVKKIKGELAAEVERLESEVATTNGKDGGKNDQDRILGKSLHRHGGADQIIASSPQLKIPNGIRKIKVTQALNLLERESALVDAVKGRLERLSLG